MNYIFKASLALAVVAFASATQAQDFDRVLLLTGQQVQGKIAEITKDKVVVQQTQASKEFPVNEIKYLVFTGEPRDLIEARNAAVEGRYELVIESLDKIPAAQLANDFIKQDADYYRAMAAARMAAGGVGDKKVAGGLLTGFIRSYPNSYHFYDANEIAGDLLVSMGLFDQAPRFYAELAKAASPDAKMRSAVATGRALQSQGKHQEAIAQFDGALAGGAKGKAAEAQALAARVGKARSMVEMNQTAEGVALLTAVIDEAPAEDNQLHGLAYNALGTAYLKTNKPKDALYAFLHVDVLYNQFPEQHAEALYNLKGLWKQMQKEDRSMEAADLLKARYSTSRWATK